jgi:CRISPR-associated protein Cmr5
MSRTIQQLRAECALTAVTAVLSRNEKEKLAYRSAARSLPAQLMMQGIGQTLAMLATENAPVCGLYVTLQDWLTRPGGPLAPEKDVLIAITTMDQNHYIAAQAEAVKLAGWLKKFAAALIEAPKTKPKAGKTPEQTEASDHESAKQ